MTTAATSKIDFDPEEHIYRIGGKPIPSVTAIMGHLRSFSGIPPEVLEFTADRGTAVHEAIALYEAKALDERSLDERILPYIEAYQTFAQECGWQPLRWETRVYHKELGYAGTIDAIGTVHGHLSIVDWKTTATLDPAVGVQLAAYERAWNNGEESAFEPVVRRQYAVQLRADGTYRLRQYDSPDDWACFRALLTEYKWRLNHA